MPDFGDNSINSVRLLILFKNCFSVGKRNEFYKKKLKQVRYINKPYRLYLRSFDNVKSNIQNCQQLCRIFYSNLYICAKHTWKHYLQQVRLATETVKFVAQNVPFIFTVTKERKKIGRELTEWLPK